ncbi:hypothetical protein [Chryseobacterium sp.]|uniref:hypothetical protein n=1 Tax=Chryseobacterium sp. TaxID=1871047 RepID=UPI0012A805E1|nr:hypothetical protein [Chryseobacterium sp.]QFG53889.1 hypothetical protein F7R58_10120 [Chryseobacterium sp.]
MTDPFKKLIYISFTALTLLAGISLDAQETEANPIQNPPVNVEEMTGNRGVSFQMILDKKLRSVPQIGFFGVTD